MKNSTTVPDLEMLSKVFQEYPDILAVYLFGSYAAGHIHRESVWIWRLFLAIPQSGQKDWIFSPTWPVPAFVMLTWSFWIPTILS